MLGQLGVVQALVEASPGVQRIPGPHDFTLLHHARMGGAGALFGRRIFPVADSAFYTSGSPTVRVVFEIADGNVTGLRIIDNEVILIATRQAG